MPVLDPVNPSLDCLKSQKFCVLAFLVHLLYERADEILSLLKLDDSTGSN